MKDSLDLVRCALSQSRVDVGQTLPYYRLLGLELQSVYSYGLMGLGLDLCLRMFPCKLISFDACMMRQLAHSPRVLSLDQVLLVFYFLIVYSLLNHLLLRAFFGGFYQFLSVIRSKFR